HLVIQPAENVDVVPAFLVVASRRIVIDADDVTKIFVELGVEIRLKDVIKNGFLALFLRLERLGIVEYFTVAVAEYVCRVPPFDTEQPGFETRRDDGLDQCLPGLEVLPGER